jgi:hypothetical protein
MRDYDYKYEFNSFNKLVEPLSNLPIYEVSDIKFIKNINNKTEIINDLCFLISMSVNYSHALLDGIGAYYQFKKLYPSLIPIFIDESRKPAQIEYKSVPLKEFAEKNNFKIININDNNYIFKNAIIHNYYFSSLPINSLNDILIENNDDDRQVKFYQNSIKEIIKNIKINKSNSFKKIYVSRKLANEDRKHHKNQFFAEKNTYDEKYDIEFEKFFISQGFEIIDLEGYTLSDQINLFSQCNIFATIEGTALINSIWMPNNSKILSIKMYETNFPWKSILNFQNKKNIFEFYPL